MKSFSIEYDNVLNEIWGQKTQINRTPQIIFSYLFCVSISDLDNYFSIQIKPNRLQNQQKNNFEWSQRWDH